MNVCNNQLNLICRVLNANFFDFNINKYKINDVLNYIESST